MGHDLIREGEHAMYNAKTPRREELPSSRQLARSTVLALAGAIAILLCIVLPAEYGIDPTGIGRPLGLTDMGEIKMQLAREAEADAIAAETPVAVPATPAVAPEATAVVVTEDVPAAPAQVEDIAEAPPAPARSDDVSFTLAPGEGAEFKLVMVAGARVDYTWTANGAVVNFDTHGNGDGQSISYEKGRGVAEDSGVLEAAFDGQHGWFWRNRTESDVTITLRVEGNYTELRRML